MSTSPRGGLSTRWGVLLHVLLIVLGWVLFVVAWRSVAQRPWDSRDLTTLIVAAALLLPLVTLLWIRHNRAIYRRLGPRRATRVVDETYTHDFNRRTVRADWAALRDLSDVVIDIDGEHKIFRSGVPAIATPGAKSAAARLSPKTAAQEISP